MSRHLILIVPLFLGFVGISAAAWAQDPTACESDDDCLDGEHCEYLPCEVEPCEPDQPECTSSCEPEGRCAADGSWWGQSGCESDGDCDDGYACQVIGGMACAEPTCPADEDCPDVGSCEPQDIYGCVPELVSCSTNEDCAEGLVCLTVEYASCADCPVGGGCDATSCEEYSESYCAPAYLAPCEVAADCGDGFDCEDVEVCGCSGGGSVGGDGPVDGGSSGGEVTCDCDPTGDYSCQPREITCESEGDCPAGWTCVTGPSPASPCYYDDATGETYCEDPGDPVSVCMPPDWSYWGAGASGGYEESLNDALGGESSRPVGLADEDEETPTPSTEEDECGCSAGGSAVGSALVIALAVLPALAARKRSTPSRGAPTECR